MGAIQVGISAMGWGNWAEWAGAAANVLVAAVALYIANRQTDFAREQTKLQIEFTREQALEQMAFSRTQVADARAALLSEAHSTATSGAQVVIDLVEQLGRITGQMTNFDVARQDLAVAIASIRHYLTRDPPDARLVAALARVGEILHQVEQAIGAAIRDQQAMVEAGQARGQTMVAFRQKVGAELRIPAEQMTALLGSLADLKPAA